MSQLFNVELPRFPQLMDDSLSKLVVLLSQHHGISNSLPFGIVSVWFLLILSFYRASGAFRTKSKNTDEALDALLTFINPTKSFWPKDIIKVASSHKNKVLKLSLNQLLSHIAAGTLEFRNPSRDLVALLINGGVHRADEWSIRLVVDSSWWTTISFWTLKSFANILKSRNLLEQGRRRKSYTFDSIPLFQIESFAREFQSHITPGSSTNLEFTARIDRPTSPNSMFILCSVPFLLRGRAPTPLFMTLHRVIRMVSEGNGATAVDNVQNYSEKYAAMLEQNVVDMVDDSAIRTDVIERCGVDGWRMERFHASLEAALIRAGFLARWKVSVRKL